MFLDNGAEIADELLVARDNGNVLFFCGAGVSMTYAGLIPDIVVENEVFVMDEFDVDREGSASR